MCSLAACNRALSVLPIQHLAAAMQRKVKRAALRAASGRRRVIFARRLRMRADGGAKLPDADCGVLSQLREDQIATLAPGRRDAPTTEPSGRHLRA